MRDTYRISELAKKAEVTKRTVHYYVGRGLLPPPEGAGVGSTYSDEHLVKLKLIKQLQERYFPLDQIRSMIADMTLEEAKRLLAEPETLPVPGMPFTSGTLPGPGMPSLPETSPGPGMPPEPGTPLLPGSLPESGVSHEPGTHPQPAGVSSAEADNRETETAPFRVTAQSDTKAAAPTDLHNSYVRCNIGWGIELHVPLELARDDPALIDSIEKYVRRLTSEK